MYTFVLSFGAHILSLLRMAKENNDHQGLPQETGGRCGSFAKAKGGPTEFGSQDEDSKGESHKETETRGVKGTRPRAPNQSEVHKLTFPNNSPLNVHKLTFPNNIPLNIAFID